MQVKLLLWVVAFASTLLCYFLHFHVFLLFRVEIFRNSVLSRELLINSLGKLHDRYSSKLHGGHSVEDWFVGDGGLEG